jgi:Alpha-L-arabinofuranosidase B, catalytic
MMLWRTAFLTMLLALCGWTHGNGYVGPCDAISTGCAEAWSVTRAETISYSGPLFQLYNGSTTLDIGQTSAHVADMTTWSAFCGGVASNCVYSKIYANIQGHSNDLVPATFNTFFGPNCSTGGVYQCAAPFAIEGATGLPILNTVAPEEYTIAADASAVGLNSGAIGMTVVYNGKPIATQEYCCGNFGRAHKYNAGDTNGTDFMISTAYGQAGVDRAECDTSTSYCIAADEEYAGGPSGDYSPTLIANFLAIVAYDPNSQDVTAWVNSHLVWTKAAGIAVTAGSSIHLGGGGDLSQPSPVVMREGLITNATMTSGDQAATFANTTAFYNGLSFP